VNVATAALLIYDYFLTFDSEVSLVWPAPWGLGKILFLLTRYLPRIDTAIVLYHNLKPRLNPGACVLAYKGTGWMFVFDIAIAEVIMSLRTWAIWNKDRRVGIGLAILFCSMLTAACVLFSPFVKSLTFAPAPNPAIVGCFMTGGNHMLSAVYVLLTVFETSIFILTLLKGARIRTPCEKQSNVLVNFKCRIALRYGRASYVAATLYRDGIIYYFYLFVITISNIVALSMAPPVYATGILSLFQRGMHSLLAVRIILHLREANARTANRTGFSLDYNISELPFPNGCSNDIPPDVCMARVSGERAGSWFDGPRSERSFDEQSDLSCNSV